MALFSLLLFTCKFWRRYLLRHVPKKKSPERCLTRAWTLGFAARRQKCPKASPKAKVPEGDVFFSIFIKPHHSPTPLKTHKNDRISFSQHSNRTILSDRTHRSLIAPRLAARANLRFFFLLSAELFELAIFRYCSATKDA